MTALQLSARVVAAALILRTWFILGLIEPMTVAGSSMAPRLRGPHIAVQCNRCGYRFDVGADLQTREVECLRCGYSKTQVGGSPISRGDYLIVDRTTFGWRLPRRWEPVVFRSPDDGELTIKRVVGLPGELIQLREGEVWADGKVAKKSLREKRDLRQRIHEESSQAHRWHEDTAAWRWVGGGWQLGAQDKDWHWLVYRHPEGKVVTNDLAYNAAISRRVFSVRDFCLVMDLQSPDAGEIAIRVDGSTERITWTWNRAVWDSIELFAFDRQVEMFVNGKRVRSVDVHSRESGVGTAMPFAIGAKGGTLHISNLQLYSDTYHASEPERIGSPVPMQPVKVGPAELYLLGDNEPVSIDSRLWGPVPLKLLVGRPLGLR